jgi:hypothetical protein
MMKLGRISSHARIGMKRQGISEAALQGLIENGREERDGCGGRIVYFDAGEPSGDVAQVPRRCRLGAYAVLDRHGEIITVRCHRTAQRGRAA